MTSPSTAQEPSGGPRDLGDFVEAFEAAQDRDGPAVLAAFLPAPDDPLYLPVLCELVRVDLDRGWQRGRPRPLEEYVRRFPDAFQDLKALGEVAFEEYRLRRQAGENPSPAEYHGRLGVNTDGWPRGTPPDGTPAAPWCLLPTDPPGLAPGAAATLPQWCGPQHPEGVGDPNSWCSSFAGSAGHLRLFRDLERSDPDTAHRLSQSLAALPEVGSEFLGFRLVAELGQGAFGKVFLARQGELADRLVALKVSSDLMGEPQTLARLQHTHIVPIYSTHRAGPLQAVCMPYLGATTLVEVIRDIGARGELPASGKALLSTLHDHKKKTDRHGSEAAPAAGAAPAPEDDPPVQPAVPQTALAELEGMTYVQAVLWVAVRLADGLVHAHERGILHRDLKPANVLLTDEGQPMLLDFNLAADARLRERPEAASVGGTLPYMAPEQLEAFRSGPRPADARSDLYSFGVILYELLTGRTPFPARRGSSIREVLQGMVADRRQLPPRLRPAARAVSPAVESIVRRCLEPDPDRRYQKAAELRDDLDRQLHHQPLRFAREPSLWERAGKFRRRHPRLTSSVSIAAIAAVLIGVLAAALAARGEHLARLRAQETFAGFRDDLQAAQFLLNARTWADQLEDGIGKSRSALGRYQVLDNPAWRSLPDVRHLPPEDRQRLEDEIGQLLLIEARAAEAKAVALPDWSRREEALRDAVRLCALAESCYAADGAPQALWKQQAELHGLLGRGEEARRLLDRAEQTPPRTARDYYLAAFLEAEQRRFREAFALLREATRRDPQDFNAHFLGGICHDNLAMNAEAAACYTTCIALRPGFYGSYFNRGLAHLRASAFRDACEDFDDALRLRPDFADAYVNRARALQGRKMYAEAIGDLTQALELGAPAGRVLLARAKARALAGDAEGAKRDRTEGLRIEPTDEQGWVERGLARLASDPAAAVADFDKALETNPCSLPALQDKAHALSKYLKRTRDAVAVLDEAVRHYPHDVRPRAGRGVLLARLGEREAAVRDAEEALTRDASPPTLYFAADIYALTSQKEPDDRKEALRLLAAALRKGYGFEHLDADPDLDPIRTDPQFRRLIDGTRALQTSSSPK
jgi:eukaryotic-like serine/threonine-protein kinase